MDRYPFRPLFSASSLDVVSRCPAAVSIPTIEITTDDALADRAERAERGTSEHAELLTTATLPALLMRWLVDDDPDAWTVSFEEPLIADFAWADIPRFARLNDPSIDRAKLAAEMHRRPWSAGTPDACSVQIRREGECELIRIRVGDLKTGEGQGRGQLPPPERSWQLRYYVIVLLGLLGWPDVPGVCLESCEVAWWTRDYEMERAIEPDLPPEERAHMWRITPAVLTAEQLLQSRDELRQLSRQLTTGQGHAFRIGSWCASCRSLLACPAHREVVDRLGVALEGPATGQNLADAYEALQIVRAQVKAAEETIEAWASRLGDVPVRGGLLRRVTRSTKRLTEHAIPFLLSNPELKSAVRNVASIASLSRALGEAVPGSRTAQVLDEITESDPNAVQTIRSFELRIHRVRSD